MMTQWQIALEEVLAIILFVDPAHKYFFVLAGIAVAALAIFGHLLAVYVAGSHSSWLSHAVAFLVPVAVGLVAMAASHLYLEPQIDEGLRMWATIGCGALGFLIAAVIAASSLLHSSGVIGVGALVLGVAAMISTSAMAKMALESFDKGEMIIKERRDRFELDALPAFPDKKK